MARIMIIDSVYDGYLKWLYKSQPGLEEKSYQTQHETTINGGFHNASVLAEPLRGMGHEVMDIWINHAPLQIRWCMENGYEKILKKTAESFTLAGVTIFQSPNNPWHELIVEQQVRNFQPDILWVANIYTLANSFLKMTKDSYGFAIGEIATALPQSGFDDFDLIVSGAMPIVEQLRSNHIDAELLLHGFNSKVLESLAPGEKNYDVSFVGQMHDGRTEMIDAISKEIAVDVWTNFDLSKITRSNSQITIHPPIYGIPMYQVLRNSKIVLNKHIYAVNNFATNQRLYEVTGVGTMLLTDTKENLRDLFVLDKEITAYSNYDQCIELAKHYLKYDNEREAIAKAGNKRTIRDHTINNRAKDIISILKSYVPSIF